MTQLLTWDCCTRVLFYSSLPHRRGSIRSNLPRPPSYRPHLVILWFLQWHTCHSYTTGEIKYYAVRKYFHNQLTKYMHFRVYLCHEISIAMQRWLALSLFLKGVRGKQYEGEEGVWREGLGHVRFHNEKTCRLVITKNHSCNTYQTQYSFWI